ncbi:MAG: UPF0149 family protein, partial [Caldimonas sp.]
DSRPEARSDMSFQSSAPPSRPPLAAAAQDLSDAEFVELDDLLAAIPEPLEPLDAVMLDGFLCGVIVQPRLIDADAWLPFVFDAGGHRWGEAEPSPEQSRARALVLRRHAALNRSIAEFGGFDPFVLEPMAAEDESVDAVADGVADDVTDAADVTPIVTDRVAASPTDPIADALLPWVAGFEQALHAFPELADMDEPAVATTLARLFRFLPETSDDGRNIAAVLASERPLTSIDDAIAEIVGCVAELYDLTEPLRYKVEPVRRDTPKVGRNDPCPCGSGRKFKQCHGAAGA